jgi:Cys-tRNA(Pro)/Cys-tRNA(Cys) deacylase
MKLPAHQYLDERAIPYEARCFPPKTEKGAASVARALGFRERQMVKTLVFRADTGEAVLVMVGGDQSVVSSHLKKVVGSRNVGMASPEEVLALTGYVIGSIPPFGWQTPGFRSLLDASLMVEPVLGVGTGQWGEEILIAPPDLGVRKRRSELPVQEAFGTPAERHGALSTKGSGGDSHISVAALALGRLTALDMTASVNIGG